MANNGSTLSMRNASPEEPSERLSPKIERLPSSLHRTDNRSYRSEDITSSSILSSDLISFKRRSNRTKGKRIRRRRRKDEPAQTTQGILKAPSFGSLNLGSGAQSTPSLRTPKRRSPRKRVSFSDDLDRWSSDGSGLNLRSLKEKDTLIALGKNTEALPRNYNWEDDHQYQSNSSIPSLSSRLQEKVHLGRGTRKVTSLSPKKKGPNIFQSNINDIQAAMVQQVHRQPSTPPTKPKRRGSNEEPPPLLSPAARWQ